MFATDVDSAREVVDELGRKALDRSPRRRDMDILCLWTKRRGSKSLAGTYIPTSTSGLGLICPGQSASQRYEIWPVSLFWWRRNSTFLVGEFCHPRAMLQTDISTSRNGHTATSKVQISNRIGSRRPNTVARRTRLLLRRYPRATVHHHPRPSRTHAGAKWRRIYEVKKVMHERKANFRCPASSSSMWGNSTSPSSQSSTTEHDEPLLDRSLAVPYLHQQLPHLTLQQERWLAHLTPPPGGV